MLLATDLTRAVGIPRWKYHLGHASVAAGVAFVALAFGAPLVWATALGAVGWALVHEALDALRAGPSLAAWRDHIADLIQHQPVWVVYFLGTGETLIAALVAALIGLLYRATLPWSRP